RPRSTRRSASAGSRTARAGPSRCASRGRPGWCWSEASIGPSPRRWRPWIQIVSTRGRRWPTRSRWPPASAAGPPPSTGTARRSGAITLPEGQARDRSARAVVFAALLRGVRAGKPSPAPAPADKLAAWIGVQRDADGGYGSALATREVVRALLDAGLEEQGT